MENVFLDGDVSGEERALSKCERKRLCERQCDVDSPLLWHQITCKLTEITVSGSDSDSSTDPDSASHDHRLVAMMVSASTAGTLNSFIVHLHDIFVRVYSKWDCCKIREKYRAFQLEWHKHAVPFTQ